MDTLTLKWQLNDYSLMTNLLAPLVEVTKCDGKIQNLKNYNFSCISIILKIKFCPYCPPWRLIWPITEGILDMVSNIPAFYHLQ